MVLQVVLRIEGAASSPVFGQAAEKLIHCKTVWVDRDEGAGEHGDKLQQIHDAVRTIEAKVRDVQRRLQVGEETVKKEKAARSREKMFGGLFGNMVKSVMRLAGKGASPGNEARDGPGELSLDGVPRHSNDAIEIANIRISKYQVGG